MEALAAVGLAGNVVQFIDFTCKLFDQAIAIHHSHAGVSQDTQDLESITRKLQQFNIQLLEATQKPSRCGASSGASAPHSNLQYLAKDCHYAAEDLLSALRGLKAKKSGSNWSSFRAALAEIWKQPRIDGLEKKLSAYRLQLIMELDLMHRQVMWHQCNQWLVDLQLIANSNEHSQLYRLMASFEHRNQMMGSEIANRIKRLQRDVQSHLQVLAATLNDHARQGHQADLPPSAVRQGDGDVDIGALADALVQEKTSGAPLLHAAFVIDSLTINTMEFRHSSIRDAYPKTCYWVFDAFVDWLQSEDPIFWISGKPGSGKSTMMKWLVNNKETELKVSQYLGGEKHVVASYFFWINGTKLQRSQEGLLRSLLHEILRQSPELVQSVLPDAWSAWSPFISSDPRARDRQYDWKREELLSAFKELATLGATTTTRFCVFIDGLDEYVGDHEELLNTIQYLTEINVKLCVASRPWNVFEDAFKDYRKLYMQNLNRPDIEFYVEENLRRHLIENRAVTSRSKRVTESWKNLDVSVDSKGHPNACQEISQVKISKADEILHEIVEKSQGVFLWVFLVVRSLKEGLRNHDRLSQLQKRLRDFPSDLDDFFGVIFRSLDPTYRTQTAHMFEVALTAEEPLSWLTFWYLDEQEDDPDLAFSMPTFCVDSDELEFRLTQITRRINGRCKGLLEVIKVKEETPYVDFLHRSVKDFLSTTQMRRTFVEWQQRGFDAQLAISKATLAELKSKEHHMLRINYLLTSILKCAKQIELEKNETPMTLLDEVERAMTAHKFQNEIEKNVEVAGLLMAALNERVVLYLRDKLCTLKTFLNDKWKLKIINSTQNAMLVFHLVSCLSPFERQLDRTVQSKLVPCFGNMSRNKVLMSMKYLCRHSPFLIRESNRFDSVEIQHALQSTLAPAELQELVELNLSGRNLESKYTERGSL